MKTIDQDGRTVSDDYEPVETSKPTTRREGFMLDTEPSGLNAFHLLAFTLLLGGVLMAVIFLMGGG